MSCSTQVMDKPLNRGFMAITWKIGNKMPQKVAFYNIFRLLLS